MKKCSHCKKQKKEFIVNGSWCRDCKRKHDKKYQRSRRASHNGLKGKEFAEYRRKFPQKVKAQQALNRAIRRGKITREPCEVCGAKIVHGHHDDYGKPLEVRWLCPVHHKLAH